MPTKIKLTLEQSQQGVSDDILIKFKNSKSKTKAQDQDYKSMNEQSHYKQEIAKTRSKEGEVKRLLQHGENVNVREIKKDLKIGGAC
ncbi:hypothetical protein Tco_0008171 [Tanacetum coccineum]